MSKKVTQKVHGELRAARQAKAERKRETKQSETGGEQHPDQDRQEATVAAKGREHTVARSMPPRAAKPTEAVTPDAPGDDGAPVVFALRISRAERDLLHEKAGSGKASRIVKALIVAATQNDPAAIEQILTQLHGTSR